jgi:CubicO group peptidase (beta-lactamase class C family)
MRFRHNKGGFTMRSGIRSGLFGVLMIVALLGQRALAGEQSCSSAHIDMSKLNAAVNWINAYQGQYIDSMIVKHCGAVLVEKYYNGYTATTRHELQSATKTISSMLIGIALDRGDLGAGVTVNTKLKDILPAQYASYFTGAKADITLKHLLNMTSGIHWEDYPGTSFDDIQAASDTIAWFLSQPLDTTPGTTFKYNTGNSHMLSAIIHVKRGGAPGATAAYANQYLFGPLGITDYVWNRTLDGINKGGWDSFLRPADFSKLGQLLLDDGKWGGQQIISTAYVNAMTSVQSDSSPVYPNTKYGYQMWINTDFGVADIAAARGYGGQDTFVMEDTEMTVTFTGNINYPTDMSQDVATLMKTYIIPSHGGTNPPPSNCATSTNSQHVGAGRAIYSYGYYYSTGAYYYLGTSGAAVTTLLQYTPGNWVIPYYGECN